MSEAEKRALQITVAIGSLVPIGAGTAGMLLGLRMLESNSVESGDLDSHFRYLSGLLLAIGIGYATTVPRIETQGRRFRLLTFTVVLGGVGRFFHFCRSVRHRRRWLQLLSWRCLWRRASLSGSTVSRFKRSVAALLGGRDRRISSRNESPLNFKCPAAASRAASSLRRPPQTRSSRPVPSEPSLLLASSGVFSL